MVKPTIVIPTGYESLQKKAETKRLLAKLMLEKGLQSNPNMQNWLQVLGQVGSMAAGQHLQGQADKMDANVSEQILRDYTNRVAGFNADADKLDAAGMVKKYGADQFLQDQLEPYKKAMTAALTERGEHTNFGGQWRSKAGIKEGEFEPNKPTDSVLRGPNNTFVANPVRTTAALEAQGFTPGGAPPMGVHSMADPLAPTDAPPAPMPLPPAGGDGLDLSLLTPDERQIMARELQRRAAGGGSFQPPHPNIPLGNPLTAQRPPAGAVNGKPYWIINGVPYDNPEGK